MKLNKFIKLFLILTIAGGAAIMLFGCKWSKGNTWSKDIIFSESNEVIVNPLIGYTANADYPALASKYSLVYVDVTWRELEPKEGVYDFENIYKENFLERWKSEGKRVVFRFVLDKPGDTEHKDIPDWLYEKIDGDGTEYNNSYGKGFSPAYDNQILINAHATAIKALGEHYGKNDFFAYIELGSLGHWGEWHVNHESGIDKLPNESVRDLYIKPYITAFPNSQILMRRPFTPVKTYGFGVFNDMTGDEDATTEWLNWIKKGGEFTQTGEKNAIVAVNDVWNTAAVGGEFTSSVNMDYLLRYHLNDTIELIKKSHMSFIGPKIPTDNIYDDGTGQVLKNVGYRFRIKNGKISSSNKNKVLTVKLDWTNDGVAPIYWNWDSYIYILDENNNILVKNKIDIDLTKLISGKSISTETSLDIKTAEDKNYKVCIGIVDPVTGEPAIKFAMSGERVGNMSVLYKEVK